MFTTENLKILKFTYEESNFLEYLLGTPEKRSTFIVDGTYPCWIPVDDKHGSVVSDDSDVNNLLIKGFLIGDDGYHDEEENEWHMTMSINKDKLEVIENYFKIELFLSSRGMIDKGEWFRLGVRDVCGMILKLINVGIYINF